MLFGEHSLSSISVNFCPNEPVPPVTSIVFPSKHEDIWNSVVTHSILCIGGNLFVMKVAVQRAMPIIGRRQTTITNLYNRSITNQFTMKIALLSTPTRTSVPNTVPPLGIMYLAPCLQKKGHIVRILDIAKTRQSNETTIAELNDFHPDLIAISGIITAYKFIHMLVHDLKPAFPSIPIVIGGHISLENTELLLKSVGCDYTIVGYGEKKIVYLVDFLEGRREITDIPGLSYIKEGTVQTNPGTIFFENIDDVPLPSYDLIDMEYYITADKTNPTLNQYLIKTGKTAPPMRSFCVIGARGCTDRCTFCVHEFEYKGFHIHSIEYVMANLQILYEQFGVRIFSFGEDLFLYKLDQVSRLVAAMNKRFPDAYFSCSTRADYVNRDLLRILEQSNCYALFYGFESGDDAVLKVLGKRMTPDTNVSAYKMIKETSITPVCSFMVGSPGETSDSIKNTISAIKRAGLIEGGLFFTTPYPGSRLFRWCREQGRINDVESYLLMISNRDASILSFNFTPYPDIIVRMMYIMVQNSFHENQKAINKTYKIGNKDRIFKHWIVPMIYHSYFFVRRCLSYIIPRYKKEMVPFELNSRGTVRLSSDPK